MPLVALNGGGGGKPRKFNPSDALEVTMKYEELDGYRTPKAINYEKILSAGHAEFEPADASLIDDQYLRVLSKCKKVCWVLDRMSDHNRDLLAATYGNVVTIPNIIMRSFRETQLVASVIVVNRGRLEQLKALCSRIHSNKASTADTTRFHELRVRARLLLGAAHAEYAELADEYEHLPYDNTSFDRR